MKINVALLLALLILGWPAGKARAAEEAAPSTSGPAISFAETVHDAGEVWEGERISHTFTFTNTGDEVLEITGIRTTCGCTAGVLSEKRIAPGESGQIQGSFNTRGYRGRRSMPVFVSSNDPRNPTVRLSIETTVKTAAAFSPRSLNFGTVRRGETTTREIKLTFEGDPVPILEISTHPVFFQARQLIEDDNDNGEENSARFQVTLSPEAPVGRHRGSVTVRLDHPEVKEVFARLSVAIEGPLSHSPPVLFFSEQDQRMGIAKSVRLTNRGDKPMAILKVESGLPQFSAEARTLREGEEFEVSVRPLPETAPERRTGEIIIRTDHPHQPSLRVPLRSAGGR